jgi:hypothetical protein
VISKVIVQAVVEGTVVLMPVLLLIRKAVFRENTGHFRRTINLPGDDLRRFKTDTAFYTLPLCHFIPLTHPGPLDHLILKLEHVLETPAVQDIVKGSSISPNTA